MSEISFSVDKFDAGIITAIAHRAAGLAAHAGVPVTKMHFEMDVTATHANGCPLRLQSLYEADDFNFAHDIWGIYRHLNRETGELMNCFVPRFARPEAD